MSELQKNEKKITIEDVIATAIQIPGVKVDRNTFLAEQFNGIDKEKLDLIIENGTIEAGCTQGELKKLASKLVSTRTLASSGLSFAAGLPGGLTMAATIPADIIQFYGVALRLAQELAYLYGEPDIWDGEKPDSEKVTNQLILYCGVMLGAAGAAQAVRVMTSSLAKQLAKTLPRKALTKTLIYPIVKSIAKAFGVKMTKEVFAKGVSKVIPVIGGVVSGGITLATMLPMGNRLQAVLDEAHFSYTEEEFNQDIEDLTIECESFEDITDDPEKESDSSEATAEAESNSSKENASESPLDKLAKAKKLLDAGVISEDEFSEIKTKLLSQI